METVSKGNIGVSLPDGAGRVSVSVFDIWLTTVPNGSGRDRVDNRIVSSDSEETVADRITGFSV